MHVPFNFFVIASLCNSVPLSTAFPWSRPDSNYAVTGRELTSGSLDDLLPLRANISNDNSSSPSAVMDQYNASVPIITIPPSPQHIPAGVSHQGSRPETVTIVLTLIPIILFLIAISGLVKFLYSYWTTPRQNATDIDFERVQREVMICEQELAFGSGSFLAQPPPPYFPRPPSYADEMLAKEVSPDAPRVHQH
ncbi:hypothetical protein DFH07DRAFT_840703 [Mycena maculata]|uniref:Transmembrane protein n=1 Tax=Mycena maculata TaxID=230809 RepID=A0AAD7ICI4_9AGAR|nr:hypothetical protein DFH07DRAFT_840703 [Mycena maculata]